MEMRCKTAKMNDINVMLLVVAMLLVSTIDAVRNANHNNDTLVDGDGDRIDDDDGSGSSKSSISHKSGDGLRWQNLGVSLENFPPTTSYMLDKYDSSGNLKSNNNNENRSLDDSLWLLHPCSGFVEDGKLCGIIGPR